MRCEFLLVSLGRGLGSGSGGWWGGGFPLENKGKWAVGEGGGWGRDQQRNFQRKTGEVFYLHFELFCLQLSFFAYSPSRPGPY